MPQDKRILWLMVRLALLAVIVLAAVWRGVNSISASMVITMIIAVLVAWFVRWRRMGELPDRDERTKKLGAYAATYSWLLTLVLIAALFWVDYLAVVKLTVMQVLGVTLIVMVLSQNLFRWHFLRRGDVE
ncbi:MAG TPA: hypothetical protein ENN68_02490 [Methanomicrobia archaeon]|nr:hypothetical protein [Methanomicrobia archaeon]